MRGSLRHSVRFLVVARELARHDALFWVDDIGPAPVGFRALVRIATRFVRKHRDLPEGEGERLAAALRRLGPAYIKLGQMLATRPDIVGPDLAAGLRALQDKLPPFPATTARAVIETALGRPLAAVFAEFDDEAVAAASIAQVHRATTSDGRAVAVKVLRPGIEAEFARDLAAFAWLARFVEANLPAARRLRPVAVVETVAETVATELDLRLEAAAASELAENMAGEPGYRVPQVDWARTARRVMTLEWVDGIPLWDTAALDAAGHDRKRLAGVIVHAFLMQAMRDGFFHADLHQGNLFVDAEGSVVALDFGIMGRLERSSRRYLAEILYGFLERDYERVARWHFSAGYVPREQSVHRFAQAMRAIAEPIFGRPVREISAGQLLGQLFATTEAFGMATQPQLLMLQRTMVMVEGMALHLHAEANMWELSRPAITAFMKEELAPELVLADRINETLATCARLPGLVERADRVLERIETEGLKLAPAGAGHEPRRSRAPALFLGALALGLTAAVTAALLLL
ncbi:MAG: 2-polyprenylphenol 6-hydroxylase [Rhodothalassiaceae bacterium]